MSRSALAARLARYLLAPRVAPAELPRSSRPPRHTRLRLDNLEAREQTGNLVPGLVAAALGGPMAEPLDAMATAVGDLAMLAARLPGEVPSEASAQATDPAATPGRDTAKTDGLSTAGESIVERRSGGPETTGPAAPGSDSAAEPFDWADFSVSDYGPLPIYPSRPADTGPGAGAGRGERPGRPAAIDTGGAGPAKPVFTDDSGPAPASEPVETGPTDGQPTQSAPTTTPVPVPVVQTPGTTLTPVPPVSPPDAPPADDPDRLTVRTAAGDADVVLDARGGRVENVRSLAAPPTGPGTKLPYGLFAFDVTGVAPGAVAQVEMVLPAGATPDSYFKQDPGTGHLSRFDFDGQTGAVISGNRVILHLRDGGRGDADGLANGVIVDPGGPGEGPPPPVQTFYIPLPEQELLSSLDVINDDADDESIQTYVSITAVADGTVLYFDHWEDGYEANIAKPGQSTTQVWGDGITGNGEAPGLQGDLINSGDVVILDNEVPAATPGDIDYDGGDKFAVTRTVAVTRFAWPPDAGPVFAEAVEVYDVRNWGAEFIVPVGPTTEQELSLDPLEDERNMFSYSGLMIMAAENGTAVSIDVDGNGTPEHTPTLGQGQSYLVNGGVQQGARITSTSPGKPLQVQLLTGTLEWNYASRWYNLLPRDQWAQSYYTPVGTTDSNNPAVVFVHNPDPDPLSFITVEYRTAFTGGSIDVYGGATGHVVVPDHSGARFSSNQDFYAIEAIDRGGRSFDWGMPLLPAERLTPQFKVGLGHGAHPVNPGTNYNPVWVTPVGNRDPIEVYVDYNGDNVPNPSTGGVDPNGFNYDFKYWLSELESVRIYDPDGDQTGMLVYVVDPGVKLMAAWGQDPATNNPGPPAIDAGTGTPPLPLFEAVKDATLVADVNGDGKIGPGDTIRYDIAIRNISRVPVSGLLIEDLVPEHTTYVPKSTILFSSENGGSRTEIPDDSSSSPFPLDESGLKLETSLLPLNEFVVSFDVLIGGAAQIPDTVESVVNKAKVTAYGLKSEPEVETPLHAAGRGAVFEDRDRDGVRDGNEPGFPGVQVTVTDRFGQVQTVTTNAAGEYTVAVPAGDVDIDVVESTLPAGFRTQTAGVDPNTVTAVAGVVADLGADGYVSTAHALSGFVYHDADNDGTKDAGEAGLQGVVVTLTGTDILGPVSRTAVTDFDGQYAFPALRPGTYTVTQTQPAGWVDGTDRVGTPAFGATVSANDTLGVFTLPAGPDAASTGNNFGEREVALGGSVFADANWNGRRDAGEAGLAGVTVTLKDAAGATLATTATLADGSYTFGPRAPGLYTVVETQPAGYGSSTPDVVSVNLAVAGQHAVTFGDTPCGAEFWNTGESGGSPAGKGTVTQDGGVRLREGDSFVVWAEKTFEVPARPGVLRVSYTDLFFDTESTGRAKDAFEIGLVDPATGRALVFPYAADRDAAFNVTEGLTAVTGRGTVHAGGAVLFDLTGLAPGSAAKLVVRLVNNDTDRATGADTDTAVKVHCVHLTAADAAKFFVVDDAADATYRYDPAGKSLGNSPLLGADGNPASPRGAASNLAGTRVWVLDSARGVWVYDASGTPVGGWRAGDALTDPQGVTTNGTDVWLVDAGSKRVYRYAGAASWTGGEGTATGSFPLHADNANPTDLVTDGTTIWVTDAGTDEVFVYAVAGTLLGRWKLDAANGNPSGVTIDPSGGTDLWVVDRQDLLVYRYAAGRTQTSGALAATSTFVLAAGQTRPEGIADPPPAGGGTDFWLALPAMQGPGSADTIVITADEDATGVVSIPGLVGVTPQTFTVAAGGRTDVSFPGVFARVMTSDTVENLGIHVTSDKNVRVYRESLFGIDMDRFTALPTAALGTEYIVLAYGNTATATYATQFTMVATADDTVVTVVPTEDTPNHLAGISYTVTLDAGQTYQLQNRSAFGDLTGTLLTSTEPIAVFAGHEYAGDGFQGFHMAEALPPTAGWGSHFVTAPIADHPGGSLVRILAQTDGTAVRVNGGDPVMVNRGFVHKIVLGGPVEITADRPVLVAQYGINPPGESDNDLYMMLVPATDQFGRAYTWVGAHVVGASTDPPYYAAEYVNIVAPTAAASQITLNGTAITGFTAVGTSGYSVAQVSVFEVPSGPFRLEGPVGFGAMAYSIKPSSVNAGFNAGSYGYPLGVDVAVPVGPAIEIIDPAEGTEVPADSTQVIRGIVHPGTAPVVTVTVNGVPVDVLDAAGNFYTRVPVGPGVNSFTFTALDERDLTASATRSLTGVAADVPDGRIEDVTPSLTGTYLRTSFNEGTDVLYAGLRVQNVGAYPVDAPVRVVIGNLSDPTVAAHKPDGFTADGLPYFDLSSFVTGPALEPGETTTDGFHLAFFNPNRVQFTYDLRYVSALNRVPTFTTVPKVSAYTGGSYTYQAAAADPDGNPLTFDLLAGPAGVNFNPGTGLLNWVPGVGDEGSHDVILRVRDGRGGAAEQRFTVSVLVAPPNRPPVLTAVPPPEAYVNTPYTFTATATDVDLEDLDDLTFALFGASAGTSAPAGMTIHPETGVVAWTPTAGQVGPQRVTFEVTDGHGLSASRVSFDLVVRPEPGTSAPVLVTEPVNTAAQVGGAPFTYSPQAVDADGDSLVYTMTTLPSGALFDPATRQVFWAPPVGGSTSAQQFVLEVADGRGWTTTQSFSVTPSSEASAMVAGVVFDDVDGNGTWDPGEGTLKGRTVYLDQNQNAVLDPGEATAESDELGDYGFTDLAPGPYHVRLVPATGWGVTTAPASGAHIVTLAPGEFLNRRYLGSQGSPPGGNHAPAFSTTAGTQATAGAIYRYDARATDLDGEAVTFDLPVAPAGMAVDPASGTLAWRPIPAQVGTHDVLLRVRDGAGGVTLQSFRVTVAGANTPPVVTSTPVAQIVAGAPFEYRVAAQDADGHALTYTLLDPGGQPAGFGIDPATGVLSWDQAGTHTATIVVSDGHGGSAEQTVSLIATAAQNLPPAFTTAGPTVIPVQLGGKLLHRVGAADPDGNPLTFFLSTTPTPPAGLSISNDGLIQWEPTEDQLGDHPVVVGVNDGQGGITYLPPFTASVRAQAGDTAPMVASTPPKAVVVGRPYAYDLTATDPEFEAIAWHLDEAPAGVSLDAARGTLRWTPGLDQVGPRTIVVRATDARGAWTTQTIALDVRGANVSPVIESIPRTTAFTGDAYYYPVRTTDLNGDALTYSVTHDLPAGDPIEIDGATGLLKWTPGDHPENEDSNGLEYYWLTVHAADGLGGAAAEQTYRVVVSDVPPNHPPAVLSRPKLVARAGFAYEYPVVGYDPDGDALTFGLEPGAPAWLGIVPATGEITGTPPAGTADDFPVAVVVTDPGGKKARQYFNLHVEENGPPTITSTPVTAETAGRVYRYDVRATDPNDDRLTWGLDPDSLARGMRIDQFGRITWRTPVLAPTAPPAVYPVTVTVTDPYGESAPPHTFDITLSADDQAPQLALEHEPLLRLHVVEEDGDTVRGHFFLRASDDVGIDRWRLVIQGNGEEIDVAVDRNGRAVYDFDAEGVYALTATVWDAAGNSTTVGSSLEVIDLLNNSPPVVQVTSPTPGAEVTAPIDVTGSVSDPENAIDSWKLSLVPFGDGPARTLATGTTAASGVLGQLDPTLLANGSYTLRLEATDAANWVKASERTVTVAGNLKLGNFTVAFTDLTIPVSGIPIAVQRSYDTLDADKQGDFGYGWRLSFGDPDLEVSLDPEAGTGWGGFPVFKDGTRVFLTTPDGQRQGFTFAPVPATSFLGTFYHPYFTPDSGNVAELEVRDVQLSRTGDGEYFSYDETGIHTYNPADPAYGGTYTLHTPDLLKYEIDADKGTLLSVSSRNGNKVTFSATAITANTGRKVDIERDTKGRIVALTDPRGNRVRYSYDAKGNLAGVADRLGNLTEFKYRTDRPHYLDAVVDPFGRTGAKTAYDADGRLSQLTDAKGETVGLTYNLGALTQTATDQLGNPATVKFDTRGNMVETANQEGVTTKATYEPGTGFLTSETQVIGTPGGGDDLTTTYTVDAKGRPLTVTDPQGITMRTTYTELGLPATQSDALGNTTAMTYDARGNVTRAETPGSDPSVITYFPNGDLKTMTVGNSTTAFEYNVHGDRTATVSPLGIRRESTFDANGNSTGTTETVGTGTAAVVIANTTAFDAADRSSGTAKVVTENEVPRTYWTTGTTYDGLGQAVGQTDQHGNPTETVYDTRGQVIETRRRAEDETGALVWVVTRTVYDDAGRAAYTTDPFLAGTSEPVAGSRTVYDDAGQVLRTEQIDGLWIDVVGTGAGRRSELVLPGTVLSAATTDHDTSGRVVKTTDQYGRETQTTYDQFGRVTQTRTESASANGTAAWLISRTAFDAYGRASVVTDSYVEGSAGPVYGSRTVYDDLGRARGSERLQGVAIDLNATTGNTTLTAAGTVIATTTTKFDAHGRTELTVSATGAVTRFEYDELGRQTVVISHAVQEGVEWVSHLTETRYDSRGRKWKERTNIRAEWAEDPNSANSTATYETDEGQVRETTFEYDAFGNLTKTTFADGAFTTSGYDDFGRKITESVVVELPPPPEAPVLQTTEYEYDGQGRLVTVVQPAVVNPATGLSVNPRTEYGYDAFGNHVTITDALGRVTGFGFDDHNRQTSRTLPAVAGEPAAVEAMAYNGFGDLDVTVDFKGQRADYVYDYELAGDTDLGLLRQVKYYAAGATTPAEVVAYTYDAFGRRDTVTETSSAGTRVTDTDYDGEGRVTRVSNADGEIHYGYNLLGQQVEMWTGPGAAVEDGVTGVEYGYDALGRLVQVRQVRQDGDDLDPAIETASAYNFAGDLTSVTVSQGSGRRHTAYEYDPARGWLTRVTNRLRANGASVLSDFQYTRRPDGQITRVVESVMQPDESYAVTTNEYVYDALNRLTREDVATSQAGGDYATDYILDLVGNRVRKVTTKEGGAVERVEGTFDARDRLTEEKVYNAAVGGTLQDTITYGYDHNGSLTLRQTTSGSRTQQTWDVRNRLAGASVATWNGTGWAPQTSAAYQYTADGIRSRVTENAVTTLYTIDGLSPSGYAQVVEERTASGVLVASYVYGASLDPISVHRVGAETGTYFGDGHSGVRQIVDATGAVLAAYRYDAFGNKAADVGTYDNSVGYRGERFDATLGQYYLRARYYDPRWGRFTAMDPFAGNYVDPLQVMRYGYANSSPILAGDPSGQFSLALSMGGMGLLAGLTVLFHPQPVNAPGPNDPVFGANDGIIIGQAVFDALLGKGAEWVFKRAGGFLYSRLFSQATENSAGAAGDAVSGAAVRSATSASSSAVAEAIQPISIAAGLRRVMELRRLFNVSAKKNISYAEVSLDTTVNGLNKLGFQRGSVLELRAVSGSTARNAEQGFLNPLLEVSDGVIKQGQWSILRYQAVQGQRHLRAFDAEAIILETIARRLGPDSSGTIRLFSELPFCGSCSGVIKQFEQLFPKVKLVVSAGV
jgi:RHS repeat-associated protein/uncharacterized repeat protein (TIGR01451 family)